MIAIRRLLVCLTVAIIVQVDGQAQVEPPSSLRVAGNTNLFQLPTDRMVPWQPGVRGGIRFYPNAVNVKDPPFNATGDGVTDDYSAITNAIAHCPADGAVYFPPGHYRMNALLRIKYPSRIVMRGAGPTNTFLESYTTTSSYDHGAITFSSDADRNTTTIISGYTSGSKQVVVSSVSGMAVGQLVRILQDNDPAIILGRLSSTVTKWQGQMMVITDISGTTVSFDRPLYHTYEARFNPTLAAFTKATTYCGMEDLTVVMKNNASTPDNPLYFYIAMNCWLTNVVVTNGYFSNISINQCYALTVRHCETYNHQVYDSNTRYGIQLANWASDCLIEDNIFQGNNLSIALQQGACGNVIGYNFASQGYGNGYPTDTGVKALIAFHGDNANNNLVVGNVVPAAGADHFWGSNRKNTFFRNWLTRTGTVNPTGLLFAQGITAFFLDATNYYHNFVGNILGSPRDLNDPNSSHTDYYMGYFRDQHGEGNEWPQAPGDPTTLSTLIQEGNFSWRTNGTHWSAGSLRLPNCYYLTNRPVWFGTLAWPPIGPDVNITSTITNSPVIPAQARYMRITY